MKAWSSPVKLGTSKHHSEVMDYTELSERLKKTLYYGMLPKTDCSSLSLTNVIVEKFGENDDLFLERLCFDFAADLSREACLSPCSLVLAMIYLDRLCKKNPNYVSSVPSSKLFLISVMVASKFLNDEGEDDEVFNTDWANSAKIDVKELNKLEREFLTAIDWSLFVDEVEFSETLSQIECKIAKQESLKRGWLTYTDIDILAQHKLLLDTWNLVVNQLVHVSVTCMAAYLASFATLFGSALVATSLPWNTQNIPLDHVSPIVTSPSPILNRQILGYNALTVDNDTIDAESEVELLVEESLLKTLEIESNSSFYTSLSTVNNINSTHDPPLSLVPYVNFPPNNQPKNPAGSASCSGLRFPDAQLSHILSCIAAPHIL